MMTSSNGNTSLLAFCAENSPVTGEFPTQSSVTQTFDVIFDLRLNKRLGKQSWGWWIETPSCPLWRHRNGTDRSECPLTHKQTRNAKLRHVPLYPWVHRNTTRCLIKTIRNIRRHYFDSQTISSTSDIAKYSFYPRTILSETISLNLHLA